MPTHDAIAQPRDMKVPPGRVDPREGTITTAWIQYFTDQGDEVSASAQRFSSVDLTGQAASIGATSMPNIIDSAGQYRITYYTRITQAASTSSSLTVSLSWTDGGVSLSLSGSAITGNTTTTVQSGTLMVHADAATPISYATTYVSVGGTPMQYSLYLTLERVDA